MEQAIKLERGGRYVIKCDYILHNAARKYMEWYLKDAFVGEDIKFIILEKGFDLAVFNDEINYTEHD